MVLSTIIALVIDVLLTGAAVYVGASLLTDVQDYGLAVGTALAGTLGLFVTYLVFGLFGGVLSAIPLIGGLLGGAVLLLALPVALFVFLTVVNAAYPGGYTKAAGISLIAWVVLAVVSAVFTMFGLLVPF